MFFKRIYILTSVYLSLSLYGFDESPVRPPNKASDKRVSFSPEVLDEKKTTPKRIHSMLCGEFESVSFTRQAFGKINLGDSLFPETESLHDRSTMADQVLLNCLSAASSSSSCQKQVLLIQGNHLSKKPSIQRDLFSSCSLVTDLNFAAASCSAKPHSNESLAFLDEDSLLKDTPSSKKPVQRGLFPSDSSSCDSKVDQLKAVKDSVDGIMPPSLIKITTELNHIGFLLRQYLALPDNDTTKTPSKVVDFLQKIKGPLANGQNKKVFRLLCAVFSLHGVCIAPELTVRDFTEDCLRSFKHEDKKTVSGKINQLLELIGVDEKTNIDLLLKSQRKSPTENKEKIKRVEQITINQLALGVRINPKKFPELSSPQGHERLFDAFCRSPEAVSTGLGLVNTLPISPESPCCAMPRNLFDLRHIVSGNTKGGKHVLLSEDEKDSVLCTFACKKNTPVLENNLNGVLLGFVDADKVSSIFPDVHNQESFLEFCMQHIQSSAIIATSVVKFRNDQQVERRLYRPDGFDYLIECCFKQDQPYLVSTAYPIFIYKQLSFEDCAAAKSDELTIASFQHLYIDDGKSEDLVVTVADLKDLLNEVYHNPNEFIRFNNIHGEYADQETGCVYVIIDIALGLKQRGKFPYEFGVYVSVPKDFL
jgi:hypothetical protein